ncbi:MAG: hypothetical protein JAY88_14740 [Candidatus Thiodiazotropha lotti]|nr:hypothetical protein [Candidatus Thiodiazotropha lotti]MCW4188321.1 hypothetical protein [Candidatus Thiodiazotropha lotti]
MQELRQSTSITIRLGPAVDAADGVTPETTLALGAADQAELLKADGAATIDISGRTFAAVTGVDGWYDLSLTAADVDTLGALDLVVQDADLCAPIFKQFQVVSQAYYDSKYGSSGMPANLMAVGGQVLETGTAQAGTTSTITLAAGATANDIVGGWVFFTGGTGAGQGAMIDDYNTSTKVATLSKTLTTAPDNTTTYIILPYGFNVVSDANPIEATVTEIQASALADLFNTDSGTDYASAVAGSVVSEIADNAGGSSLTEAGIADAVWDEARAGHTGAGSMGETMGTVEANIDNLDAPISGVSGGGLDAAGVRTAIGMASANLDTQLAGLPTAAENRAEMDANSVGMAAIGAAIAGLNDPTAVTIANQVWATVCESQGSYTAQQVMSILLSVIAGRTSSSGSIFSTPDGAAQRVAATLDASNNRTGMTITPSS